MTREDFNAYCAGLPATTHVVQWGNSDVWKVGGKLFAVAGWHEDEAAYTFKVTPLAYEVLSDMPGLRPAPYLASRGMKWIQHYGKPGLSDAELKSHVRASYDMITAALPRRIKEGLQIGQ